MKILIRIAALFRNASEADAAFSDLKLRGFNILEERPAVAGNQEEPEGERTPNVVVTVAGAGAEMNPGSPVNWGRGDLTPGTIGWSLFAEEEGAEGPLAVQNEEEGEGTVMIVEVDSTQVTVVRTLLEANGASKIRILD